MPRYTFKNSDTNEYENHYVSISNLDDFKRDNPHLQQTLSTPPTGDSCRLGVRKTSDGFQDLLKNINRRIPGSTIQTRS